MQAQLQEQERQRQQLEENQQRLATQLLAEKAAREAQAQRLTDLTQFLQTLGQQSGFSLPPSLLAPPLPVHPVHSATVSTKVYCFPLCFACITYTLLG